jgi:NTE family protein
VAEFRDKAEMLGRLWSGLTTNQIFRVDIPSLARNVLSWGARLFMGQASHHIQARSLVDTSPLCAMLDHLLQPVHRHLPGIAWNLVHGGLKAVAVTASSYSTGQSVTWVQGDPPAPAHGQRKFMRCKLRIDHILASAALPLLFPAVRINRRWFGDGGIRMTAPLAPAVHLGAEKILAISTRYARGPYEQERPQIDAYPPPAQVVGALFNAIFLNLDLLASGCPICRLLLLSRAAIFFRWVFCGSRGLVLGAWLFVCASGRPFGLLKLGRGMGLTQRF